MKAMAFPNMRLATLADLDALLALEVHFPGDRLSRANLRYLLRRGRAEIWIHEQEGMLAGELVMLYRRGTRSARIYSLLVHPLYRGRGIGQLLLGAAERAARRRACQVIRLEVRPDNISAMRLYQKTGYTVVRRIEDFYEDGSAAWVMRKGVAHASDADSDLVSSTVRPTIDRPGAACD